MFRWNPQGVSQAGRVHPPTGDSPSARALALGTGAPTGHRAHSRADRGGASAREDSLRNSDLRLISGAGDTECRDSQYSIGIIYGSYTVH